MHFMGFIRAVVIVYLSAFYNVYADNEAVNGIDGEVIKIDSGSKKSCNCGKKKSDTEKQKEEKFAENASKSLSASFLNADKNKSFIDDCFSDIKAKNMSIEEIYIK